MYQTVQSRKGARLLSIDACCCLEEKLERKLHRSRTALLVLRRKRTNVLIEHLSRSAECRARTSWIDTTEIRVVQEVESFRAKLQPQSFTYGKLAPDRHVDLPVAETAHKVPGSAAELPGGWINESGWIYGTSAWVLRPINVDGLVRYDIETWAVLTPRGGVSELSPADRHGKASSRDQSAIEPPMVRQSLCKPIATHTRQIPTPAALEIVTYVEIAVPTDESRLADS